MAAFRPARLALALVLLPAGSAVAQDRFSGDGAHTDNPALLYPAFSGRCADSAGNETDCAPVAACGKGACETAATDWMAGTVEPGWFRGGFDASFSLTKRVSAEYETGDTPDYELAIEPEVALRRDGGDNRFEANASAVVDYPFDETVNLSALQAGVLFEHDASAATTLFFSADYSRTTPRAEDPSLPDATATPPTTDSLAGEVGLRHRFARVEVEGRLGGELEQVSDSVLVDTSVVDNADLSFAGWGVGGRVSVAASPAWRVFVDAERWERSFAAASGTFGAKRDSVRTEASVGLGYQYSTVFDAELSYGVFAQDFKDAALADFDGHVLAGSLGWRPNRTTELTAAVSTDIGTTTEPGATAAVTHRLEVDGSRDVTDTVRLRAGASAESTRFEGTTATRQTYGLDAGVDYLLNRFTRLFADVAGVLTEDSADGTDKALTVQAGVTFSR